MRCCTRFPELEVHEAPAEELPFADDSFDLALAQLVVAFMQDAPEAMRELARVAHRVAICMWGVEEVQMFAAIGRTAQVIDSGAAELSARRYRTPQELHDLLAGAGLKDVEAGELDVTASYTDFDDFWSALELCRSVPPAPGCTVSIPNAAHSRTTSSTGSSAARTARSSSAAAPSPRAPPAVPR